MKVAVLPNARALWLSRHVLPNEPALRSWLWARVPVGLDVDDVVQETYAVLAALPSIDHILNPKAYVFQTAASILFQHTRRSRVVAIYPVDDVERIAGAADQVSPEQEVIERDGFARFAVALADLPSRCRQVFTLRKIEGLSQREVASELGISESTVEKHMIKGLKLLMQHLADSGKSVSGASVHVPEPVRSFDARARDKR